MKKSNSVEVGDICRATGGAIKKLKVKVCQFIYGNIKYLFFNDYSRAIDRQVDLQNGNINWAKYVDKWCYIWGDFLPDKTTRTGKIKSKFLVLRIQIADNEEME